MVISLSAYAEPRINKSVICCLSRLWERRFQLLRAKNRMWLKVTHQSELTRTLLQQVAGFYSKIASRMTFSIRHRSAFAFMVVGITLSTVYFAFQYYMGDAQVEFNSQTLNAFAKPNGWETESDLKIPLVVHHTWKRSTPPPGELVRWRQGCMKLNSEYQFVMYNDEDLLAFTRQHYQQYLPMFEHLHGVYMADMARVLLAYHYGGIYMDLDFYCHRPFRCLVKHVQKLAQEQHTSSVHRRLSRNETHAHHNDHHNKTHDVTSNLPKDVLVVSREPLAHAVLFRNKTRVVIQDFFLSTPKHPFFLWLLNDRWEEFTRSSAFQPPSLATNASSTPAVVSVHVDKPTFRKGPFSYSIEKDIDRYLQYKKDHSLSASTDSLSGSSGVEDDVIIELNEDLLHPLVDSTNPRLQSVCAEYKKTGAESGGTTLANARKQVCKDMEASRYFKPTKHTMMVHMWTHVYLGWSVARGLYNSWTYHTVESTMPPTKECF